MERLLIDHYVLSRRDPTLSVVKYEFSISINHYKGLGRLFHRSLPQLEILCFCLENSLLSLTIGYKTYLTKLNLLHYYLYGDALLAAIAVQNCSNPI